MAPPPFLLVGKGAQAKLSAFDNDQSVNARGVGFEVTLLRGGFHDKSGAIGKLRQASVRIVPEEVGTPDYHRSGPIAPISASSVSSLKAIRTIH